MATFAFAGGTDEIAGWGQRNRIRFLGTWANAEKWRIDFTTSVQEDFTVGYGDLLNGASEGLTGAATFDYGLVHSDRMYLANGTFWNFSALLDPTGWEQQNVGAGFQSFSTSYGITDFTVSMAITQGRLAVFGRQNIQIWQVDADPAAFARLQILQNAGTVAPDSVQSVGELDVLYLDDTGFRSLRTKETTLNAFVDDVGSPIDKTIQSVLLGLTDEQKAATLSIVEPQSKRYWAYLNGVLYVLSRYPSAKISAWTTYELQWFTGGLGRVITPIRFFIHEGKVHVFGTFSLGPVTNICGLFIYGGTNGATYDEHQVTVDLPWISLDQPATIKQACGLHAAFAGGWEIFASMNPTAAAMQKIVDRGSLTTPSELTDSTYDIGHFNYQATGTHFHLKAISEAAATRQVLSMLTLLYNDANRR